MTKQSATAIVLLADCSKWAGNVGLLGGQNPSQVGKTRGKSNALSGPRDTVVN
jgi:hypothetical protein